MPRLLTIGQPVTNPERHLHGVVTDWHPSGAGRVRWEDDSANDVGPQHDLLTETTTCNASTALGPCTDEALPGDLRCVEHGGCERGDNA